MHAFFVVLQNLLLVSRPDAAHQPIPARDVLVQLDIPGAGVGLEAGRGHLWVIGIPTHHRTGNDLVEGDPHRVDVFGFDRIFLL